MHRAKIGLGPGRVMWGGPTPPRHAFDMAAVVGTRSVEHRGDNGRQELHLAEGIAGTSHRMVCKRTASNCDDLVVFDDAVADLLSCLEATPLHSICPPSRLLHACLVKCDHPFLNQLGEFICHTNHG